MQPLHIAVVLAVTITSGATAAAPAPGTHLLESYVAIQQALAADTLEGIKEASGHVSQGAGQLKPKDPAAFKRVALASKAVGAAKDLTSARAAFKELSAAVLAVSDRGLLGKHALVAVHCPMADASWLQVGTAVKNPYYGKEMLACGTPRPKGAPP